MRNKAFTLIEVLVVMTIIGVLASVVLVSFSGQRERAKLTKAQNFDAQVSHSLGAYAVGIWRFEEGSGTTLYDASGFNNDGTLGDGTCVPGAGTCPDFVDSGVYSGTTALQFDGIDDYVNCGNDSSLDITDAITIEAWIKINDVATTQAIIRKYKGGGLSLYGFVYTSAGNLQAQVRDDSNNRVNAEALMPSPTLWHHIAMTLSGKTVTSYVDGVYLTEDTNALFTSANTSGLDLEIGIQSGIVPFNGVIDNVAIYDEALSVGQIQQHYAQGALSHNIATK